MPDVQSPCPQPLLADWSLLALNDNAKSARRLTEVQKLALLSAYRPAGAPPVPGCRFWLESGMGTRLSVSLRVSMRQPSPVWHATVAAWGALLVDEDLAYGVKILSGAGDWQIVREVGPCVAHLFKRLTDDEMQALKLLPFAAGRANDR